GNVDRILAARVLADRIVCVTRLYFGSSATKPLRPWLQTRIRIFSLGFNLLLMATRSFAFLTGCLFTSWITSPSRRPAFAADDSASISAITAPLTSFERLSAL